MARRSPPGQKSPGKQQRGRKDHETKVPQGPFGVDFTGSWEDSVPPEVAAIYRRIESDPRTPELTDGLRRRGFHDKAIEILFRNVALLPTDWKEEHETWNHAVKRRQRLARKLSELANEIAIDPDLGGWCFDIRGQSLGSPFDDHGDHTSLAQLLHMAVDFLQPSHTLKVQLSDDRIVTAAEYEKETKPSREVSLQTFAINRIFDHITHHGAFELFLKTKNQSRPIPTDKFIGVHKEFKRSCADGSFRVPRAPNRETEILVSILLKKPIKPGTVTQVRRMGRRKYYPDK